jgi:hypothetical protein
VDEPARSREDTAVRTYADRGRVAPAAHVRSDGMLTVEGNASAVGKIVQ